MPAAPGTEAGGGPSTTLAAAIRPLTTGGSVPPGRTTPTAGVVPPAGGSAPSGEATPAGKIVPVVSAPASAPLFSSSQAFTGAPSTGNVNPQATPITPFIGAASTLSLGTSLIVAFFVMMSSFVYAL